MLLKWLEKLSLRLILRRVWTASLAQAAVIARLGGKWIRKPACQSSKSPHRNQRPPARLAHPPLAVSHSHPIRFHLLRPPLHRAGTLPWRHGWGIWQSSHLPHRWHGGFPWKRAELPHALGHYTRRLGLKPNSLWRSSSDVKLTPLWTGCPWVAQNFQPRFLGEIEWCARFLIFFVIIFTRRLKSRVVQSF